MIIARQSTARIVTVGPILDADGVAVTDGVVGDLKISKNGGAPAALNGSATLTHRHTGFYSLSLTTSDLDTVGSAEVVIDDTVNAMPMKCLTVIEEAIYDALFAASATGLLPANVTQFGGSNGTFSGGRPEVNTTHAAGTAWGSGAITAASIAANAITAAKIAADAIDADAIAADAVTEIQSGLSTLNAAGVRTAVGLASANLDTQLSTIDTVVDSILIDTAEIGAAGAGLTNITLPDQTMNITGNLSGSVGSVTGDVGGDVLGNVEGDVLGEVASIGAAGIADTSFAASALNEIADGVLDRNMAAGTDSGTDDGTFRTPRQALRSSRNKVTIVEGVATVTKEDDTTPSWTAAVSTAAGDPITGVDPT